MDYQASQSLASDLLGDGTNFDLQDFSNDPYNGASEATNVLNMWVSVKLCRSAVTNRTVLVFGLTLSRSLTLKRPIELARMILLGKRPVNKQ